MGNSITNLIGLTQFNEFCTKISGTSPPSPPNLGGTKIESLPNLGNLGDKCVSPISASTQVAFFATESVLYVDSSARGTADMIINLNGVSSIDTSDFA